MPIPTRVNSDTDTDTVAGSAGSPEVLEVEEAETTNDGTRRKNAYGSTHLIAMYCAKCNTFWQG